MVMEVIILSLEDSALIPTKLWRVLNYLLERCPGFLLIHYKIF